MRPEIPGGVIDRVDERADFRLRLHLRIEGAHGQTLLRARCNNARKIVDDGSKKDGQFADLLARNLSFLNEYRYPAIG